MKHTLRIIPTCIALGLATLAGAASAQSSSVTIFGVADAALRHTSANGITNTQLASGAYSSTRFGFRGNEDLGGGLSASFWLESFLNVDTGLATPGGFQRRSTVSLASREWGELRLGRDYTPTHSNWARFDPFGYVGIGAVQLFSLSATGNTPVTSAFAANPNTIQRANNGVAYFLPRNAWGLEGGLVQNLGENGTSANDQHKSYGGRLGVTVGPVFVSAATFRTRNDRTAGNTFRDTAVAASYDHPVVKLSGGVRRFEYLNARQNNYLLAAVVPFGANSEFKFSWNRADMDGAVGATSIGNDQTNQYAVGYVYKLSKRSRLYTTFASMKNKGNARFVVPGSPATAVAGVSSRGFEIGFNHDF